MKKMLILAGLMLAGAGVASADDFSFSFSFGDRHGWRPREVRYARPVYCYDPCPTYRYYRPSCYDRGWYRPDYYDGGCWVPRRSVVVLRSCD